MREIWILVGVLAACCLAVGLDYLVVAHADAIRLSHNAYPPSAEYSGVARGMNDVLVTVVGGLTIVGLVSAGLLLSRGVIKRAVVILTLALFGAGFVCLDANVVSMSGWLIYCGSCGGEPQTAADEAGRAFHLSGLIGLCAVAQLVWLRLQNEM